MEERTLRKMAVEQYLQGKTAVSIYQETGRSKYWFFKWLHRYQSGDANWYQDPPRIPQSHPHQISPEMRKLIINIRKQLEKHPYAQIGTSAIKWEFKKNSLYPQGRRIPLFHRSPGFQQHPSSGPSRGKIHQGRWAFLFAQYHGSLQPPGLSSSPTKKRRPSRGPGVNQMLEDYGHARLPSSRQPTLLSRKQSLPSFLWHCPQSLSVAGDRGGLYPYKRTLA
ncbi:MAG: hypothetical protein ACFFAE_12815 [Candidatus Hodarchaeota archaeon]